MNDMTLSPAGAAFLRAEEGFVDHWYADIAGVGTIGVGFTWRSPAFRTWWERNRPQQTFGPSSTMTREEADKALMFISQLEYGAAVNKFLGRAVKQSVFDGMHSVVYNLGPGSLKWKWAAAVKAGNMEEAAQRLRSTGTTAGGKVVRGLLLRRKEEAELIQHGDYTIGASNSALADGVLRRGERGDSVLALQRDLGKLRLYAGSVDGIFGYGTEAAVLSFQRGRGLEPDGVAGPKTLAAITEALIDVGGVAAPTLHPLPPQSAAAKGLAVLVTLIVGVVKALFRRGSA